MIRTKTLREPASPADGTRIYIGRRYPRGVRDNTLWHERLHDLGPSLELHRAVLHEGLPFDEYVRRFHDELAAPGPQRLLANLRARSEAGETLTLLCDHPKALPDAHCHRFLVQAALQRATP